MTQATTVATAWAAMVATALVVIVATAWAAMVAIALVVMVATALVDTAGSPWADMGD